MNVPASIIALNLVSAPVPHDGQLPRPIDNLAVALLRADETPVQEAAVVKAAPAATATRQEVDQNDIVVTARPRIAISDPLENANVKSFEVTQSVDKAFVGPIALSYQHRVPKPIRIGLRNFLYNLREPVVFLNFLVQLKPGKSAETFGRFAINTTIGGAGLVDIAKRHPFALPRRANGFADSMGYYGIKPGPFLFLPLIGPTTLRDLVGDGLDRLVLPLAFGKPFNQATFTLPTSFVGALDRRAEFDEQLQKIRDGSANPYEASRTFYLRRREAEIDDLRGRQATHLLSFTIADALLRRYFRKSHLAAP
ncbi:MlaA family lipoprotein [Sphingobium cupriresistens]|jgi:phospholipid-binding lipoprotein MlaA|uniref:MlaA family lipoprotein n=1 Tax=Sphingobium cupriresistens TaxID=1132417 RepID=UPI00191BE163|nr:VacJ family lipoprotein [Sphingobium cupriresistens]